MKSRKIKSISVEGVVDANSTASAYQFIEIINTVCQSINEEQLRQDMLKVSKRYRNWFYDYGFGGHHMWVSRMDTNTRVLLVKFEQ